MISDPDCRKYLGVIINRNPSINYGSFIYVNIVGVKKDFSDKTLTTPISDIVPMNADSTMIATGSDTAVMSYKYPRERLTSGVCHLAG